MTSVWGTTEHDLLKSGQFICLRKTSIGRDVSWYMNRRTKWKTKRWNSPKGNNACASQTPVESREHASKCWFLVIWVILLLYLSIHFNQLAFQFCVQYILVYDEQSEMPPPPPPAYKKVRKVRKVVKSDQAPDPTTMTIKELIYYQPTSNPLPQK